MLVYSEFEFMREATVVLQQQRSMRIVNFLISFPGWSWFFADHSGKRLRIVIRIDFSY